MTSDLIEDLPKRPETCLRLEIRDLHTSLDLSYDLSKRTFLYSSILDHGPIIGPAAPMGGIADMVG